MYRGTLYPSPSKEQLTSGSLDRETIDWGTIQALNLSQSILFTNEESILKKEVNSFPFHFLSQY